MKQIIITLIFYFAFLIQNFAQITTQDEGSFNSYCECENVFLASDSSIITSPGFNVLTTGYKMAMVDKDIIRGSCWDFVNEVYNRSGFADLKATVFKSKKGGPYAKADLVQPGDWIYHVNHQFNNSEHSAIFICWKDFAKRIGITLSYAGGNKNEPGKFGEYQLNSIYSVFRPLGSAAK